MTSQRTPVVGPAYLQIADDFRIAIEVGDLQAGDPLPSLAEISTKYGVSQAVARQAVGVLKAQALITTGQGRQPTVRGPRARITRSNRQHHEAKRRVGWSESRRRTHGALEDTTGISVHEVSLRVDYSRVTADDRVPEFEQGTPLLQREYETTDEQGRRIAWSTSWLPVPLIEANPDLLDSNKEPWPGGTHHQLSTVDVEVVEIVDTITAQAPSTVEAQRWGMSPGEPLFVTRDAMRDASGAIVCASVAQYPAETTQFEFVTPLARRRKG